MKAGMRMLALTMCGLATSVHAQQEKLIRERDLSEAALIQALDPNGEAAHGGEMRLRSIRVQREGEPAREPVPLLKAAPAPKAALLITFATDSAELTPRARQSLDVLARALASDRLATLHFAVEGHADPRGTPEANRRLSQLRAEAVRRYLADAGRIDAARLRAIGKGDMEPLDPAHPAAEENRRVTIVTLAR